MLVKPEETFESAFSKKEFSRAIPEILIEIGAEKIQNLIPQLVEKGFVKSENEFICLVKQNDVQLNKEKLTEDDLDRVLMNDEVLQIGKKLIRFIK